VTACFASGEDAIRLEMAFLAKAIRAALRLGYPPEHTALLAAFKLSKVNTVRIPVLGLEI